MPNSISNKPGFYDEPQSTNVDNKGTIQAKNKDTNTLKKTASGTTTSSDSSNK